MKQLRSGHGIEFRIQIINSFYTKKGISKTPQLFVPLNNWCVKRRIESLIESDRIVVIDADIEVLNTVC